jgi:hypothetical protein
VSEEREPTEPVERQAPDDPTRYEEGSSTPPPGEDSGEERAEKVAGRDKDPGDEETYEGGLPA